MTAAAVIAISACVYAFGCSHARHSSDSLMLPLVSLQHWTPFYWGQNRYGMLAPLLALPFEHPFHNLLAQAWLLAASGLVAPLLLARWALAERWLLPGLAGALLVLLLPGHYRFEYLFVQPYGLSLCLGAAGLLLLEARSRGGRLPALFAWLLAFWVNLALAIPLGAVLGVQRWLTSERSQRLRAVALGGGLMLLAFLPNLALTRTAKERVVYRMLPPKLWLESWARLVAGSGALLSLALGVSLVIALVAGAFAIARPESRASALRASAPLLAGAVANLLFSGMMGWVRQNEYSARYLLPSLVLLAMSALVAAAQQLPLPAPRWSAPMLFAALPLCAMLDGPPSYSGARSALDRALVAKADPALAARATHVVGDYWRVWPAVFAANHVRHERGEEAQVWGVTYRASATEPLWRALPEPERRYLALGDASQVEEARTRFALPPLVESETPGLLRHAGPGSESPAK